MLYSHAVKHQERVLKLAEQNGANLILLFVFVFVRFYKWIPRTVILYVKQRTILPLSLPLLALCH